MTHEDVLKSLTADTRAALNQRSNVKGLIHLAGHFGVITVLTTLILAKIPLWPLLLPIQGVLLVFLFTLQHECTHKTPFASHALNETIGHITGFLIFQPFLWFRYFHLAHHRHTNDPERDPELENGAIPTSRKAWLFRVSGLPLWRASAQRLWTNTKGLATDDYIPATANSRIKREARIMLAGYVLAATTLAFSPALIWVWLLPLILGQPVLRLYLMAEHGRCPQVANMLENTRTVFTTRLIRALAWNMPYHIEHHSAPGVPFHKLPDLHREMKPHLITISHGYTEFTRASITDLQT